MPRFTFLLLLILPNYSWACSCGRAGILKSRHHAAVIFTGTLIRSHTVIYTDTLSTSKAEVFTRSARLTRFTFRVDKLYKGQTRADTVSILTSAGGADCGSNFSTNRSYLIYSWYTDRRPNDFRTEYTKVGKHLTTSVCSRTKANTFLTFYEKFWLAVL